MQRSTVLRGQTARGWNTILESRMSTFGFWAVIPAYLNHALEVHVHTVGELEGLEVREAHYRRAWSEVLDLLEPEINIQIRIHNSQTRCIMYTNRNCISQNYIYPTMRRSNSQLKSVIT